MYKGIIRAGEKPELDLKVNEYNLKEFTQEEERRKAAREDVFKQFELSGQEAEFVLGGFDFDYPSGFRRTDILDKARIEGEHIVREAVANADMVRDAARQEGFKAGHADGFRDGIMKAEPFLGTIQQMIEQVATARKRVYHDMEGDILELVTHVARQVIQHEIKSDPEIVKEVIRHAAERILAQERVLVRVNPEDLHLAETVRPDVMRHVENLEGVDFKADDNIARGGCVIETERDVIDAQIESQIAEIHRAIIKRRKEASGETD